MDKTYLENYLLDIHVTADSRTQSCQLFDTIKPLGKTTLPSEYMFEGKSLRT